VVGKIRRRRRGGGEGRRGWMEDGEATYFTLDDMRRCLTIVGYHRFVM
jgi:hypothetical protein